MILIRGTGDDYPTIRYFHIDAYVIQIPLVVASVRGFNQHATADDLIRKARQVNCTGMITL